MVKMKSKVVAGIVVIGMVSSMGSVFAATDAGGQLHNWYGKTTTAIKLVIAGDFFKYSAGKSTAHATAVNEIKGQAQEDIRDAGIAAREGAQQSINNQVSAYTGQINAAQAAITSNMPGEYDALVAKSNAVTDTTVAVTGVLNKAEINSAIKYHKETYMNRLNAGVADTQAAAVTTLNDKITAAEAGLNALLAAEQTAATAEIKAHLDSKLAALVAELQALADKGVAEAKAALDARAAELLKSNLAALDVIVDAIDK